ncbi:glycosyl-4,4'-diaponeurosporenoate acyltransferase CrtO family protein [Winogradskyella vidalii]|uniref:glycosyl-4,4'-diaponeurosporenoate acyltransferase CrtO family protein n=1 Tax=Winogradskyella vidalii TaxID=2615024 RepID=UPI0015C754CF|nr:hypothetical protein [Winogradskyella vidalii]
MTTSIYLLNTITITFISWTVGLLLNNAIKTKSFYYKIENLNFIKNTAIIKALGLDKFGWLIKNSVFKVFNQKLKLKRSASRGDLQQVRNEMVYAEIGHLIGFIFMLLLLFIKFLKGNTNMLFCYLRLTLSLTFILYGFNS